MSFKPTSIEELQDFVRYSAEHEIKRLLPRGGGSKPALSTPLEEVAALEMSEISGILEYQPGEFTFTALAGTPISQVNRALAAHCQYLPCDPPLAGRGATLGGTLAAGVNGPGRYRYGGLRDFILGVRYVDGEGQLVRAGGKVVKNSAGFDLPKLMVGSRGELGVLVELSFKVFPRPQAFVTLRKECLDLNDALQTMQRAAAARLDIDSLDMEPAAAGEAGPPGYIVWVRLGGMPAALPARLEKLSEVVGQAAALHESEDAHIWRQASEFAWVPPEWCLVKVPLTPARIPALETALLDKPIRRRYSVGGQVAWLAFAPPLESLKALLSSQKLVGLALFGEPGMAQLGEMPGESFLRKVKSAMDPAHRFSPVY